MSLPRENRMRRSDSESSTLSFTDLQRNPPQWSRQVELLMDMRALQNRYQELLEAQEAAQLRCRCGIFHQNSHGHPCHSGPSSMRTSSENPPSYTTNEPELNQQSTTAPIQAQILSPPSQENVTVSVGLIEAEGITVSNLQLNMSVGALTSFMNLRGNSLLTELAERGTPLRSRETTIWNNLNQ